MVFVSKIYLSFLSSYQECVFIMILQGSWLFIFIYLFFNIGYEMGSEIYALRIIVMKWVCNSCPLNV